MKARRRDGGLAHAVAMPSLFLMLLASPAQCRPELLDAGISFTSTSEVSSTAESREAEDCDLVFCTKTRCDSRTLGWLDCYCCEPQKPDAPCYKTREACTAECPICDTKRSP